MFLKKTFKTPKKFKKLEILCQNAIFISIFDKLKTADFHWKNGDVSRTQIMCYVIRMVYGSTLGKVQLRKVSSL